MFNNIKYHITGLALRLQDKNYPSSLQIKLTLTPHKDKHGYKGKIELVIDLDDMKKITNDTESKKNIEKLKHMGKTPYAEWELIGRKIFTAIRKEYDLKIIKLNF